VVLQKGLHRFGWERHYEAIIGMRKVYGQIVRLALHPGMTTSASPKSACASPAGCTSGTKIS
jgi:hypothetical protein